MANPASLLIFTDLDGTLLNSEDYAYAAALPVLELLKRKGIPVIPVTSKTRQEVEELRQTVGLSDPFIVENGSAVFIPKESNTFALPPEAEAVEEMGGYQVLQLGCSYVMARAGLRAISQELGRPLKGFGDWSIEQVQQRTGLPYEDAKQAKAREFSEPFMTPQNVTTEKLIDVVEDLGFRVVVGDRFSHLIGGEAGKGRAVRQLAALYRSPQGPGETASALTLMGLGNSPNDLDMLKNVDIPIVLPGKNGPHPQLADRGWKIAPQPAPEGWATVVMAHLQHHGLT